VGKGARPIKFTFYVLFLFCLAASTAEGQKAKNEPRMLNTPSTFYKAGAFLEIGEADRIVYITGLMDGFYASAFFGASDETIASPTSCAQAKNV
jgi:hypothetical protein